jgi:hypothetical protein
MRAALSLAAPVMMILAVTACATPCKGRRKSRSGR